MSFSLPEVLTELDQAIAQAAPEELPTVLGRLVELEERARLRLRSQASENGKRVSGEEEDRLLTLPQVAEILSVPEEHARELGRRGELPTVKVGEHCVRVRLRSLALWIAARERKSLYKSIKHRA